MNKKQLSPENLALIATKEFLTFAEAAQFIGVSDSWLYKLTMQRQIPHFKPRGKMLYFNRLELEAWIQQNRIKTSDEIEQEAATYLVTTGKGKKGGAK
jgi:excisionase family DNA binding protein